MRLLDNPMGYSAENLTPPATIWARHTRLFTAVV